MIAMLFRPFAVFSIITGAALATSADDIVDGVVDLTPENFDTFVGKAKAALVEFYAPWCGHCKKLAPEWAKLGLAAEGNSRIIIGKVNADEYSSLGARFGVTAFPTIKYFPADMMDPEIYEGERTAEAFVKFLNEEASAALVLTEALSYVKQLTASNFASIVEDTSSDVLVKFYAPWCTHCQSLAPTYEKLAKAFRAERHVIIAKFDASDAESVVSKRYDITGFPQLLWFGKHDKSGNANNLYNGARDLRALVKFVNEKAATKRLVSGDLDHTAGVHSACTAAAKAFYDLPSDENKNALQHAVEVANKAGHDTNYYLNVVQKSAEKKQDLASFTVMEKSRLQRLLDSNSVSASQRDSLVIRRNILSAFQLGYSEDPSANPWVATVENIQGAMNSMTDTIIHGLASIGYKAMETVPQLKPILESLTTTLEDLKKQYFDKSEL